MQIQIARMMCKQDVHIPGTSPKRGLDLRRSGGETPAEHGMTLDTATGLLTIRNIARPMAGAPVHVPTANILWAEEIEIVPLGEPLGEPVVLPGPEALAVTPKPAKTASKPGKVTVWEEE